MAGTPKGEGVGEGRRRGRLVVHGQCWMMGRGLATFPAAAIKRSATLPRPAQGIDAMRARRRARQEGRSPSANPSRWQLVQGECYRPSAQCAARRRKACSRWAGVGRARDLGQRGSRLNRLMVQQCPAPSARDPGAFLPASLPVRACSRGFSLPQVSRDAPARAGCSSRFVRRVPKSWTPQGGGLEGPRG